MSTKTMLDYLEELYYSLGVWNIQSNIGEQCYECHDLSFETSLTFWDAFTALGPINLETQSVLYPVSAACRSLVNPSTWMQTSLVYWPFCSWHVAIVKCLSDFFPVSWSVVVYIKQITSSVMDSFHLSPHYNFYYKRNNIVESWINVYPNVIAS